MATIFASSSRVQPAAEPVAVLATLQGSACGRTRGGPRYAAGFSLRPNPWRSSLRCGPLKEFVPIIGLGFVESVAVLAALRVARTRLSGTGSRSDRYADPTRRHVEP